MKFKIGDKVRIRKDLVCGDVYCMFDGSRGIMLTRDMFKRRGAVVTIYGTTSSGYYLIANSSRRWTDSMFEPEVIIPNDIAPNENRVVNFEVGQRVKFVGKELSFLLGELGTVLTNYRNFVLVEFDSEIPHGHNGNSSNGVAGRMGHCYYCEASDLKTIVDETTTSTFAQNCDADCGNQSVGVWTRVEVSGVTYGEVYYQHKECEVNETQLFPSPYNFCPNCGLKMTGEKKK